jgi:hypothetical protein
MTALIFGLIFAGLVYSGLGSIEITFPGLEAPATPAAG